MKIGYSYDLRSNTIKLASLGGHTLKKLFDYIFIVAIVLNLGSLVWFILGASSFFMRGFDLVMTVLFMYLGVPSLLLLIISMILLYRNKNRSRKLTIIKFILSIIFMILAYNLYNSVDNYGWLQTRIHSESIKLSEDNKYEYKIELVNMFQKNSFARLYMKNVQTEEIVYISLDVDTRHIGGFSMDQVNNWGNLIATQVEDQYILYTNEKFPFPVGSYLVDVKRNSSEKLNKE